MKGLESPSRWEGGTAQGPGRPLAEAVADWLMGEPETLALWQSFGEEHGAQDYARFLDKLQETVNYGDEAFQQAVRDDLRQAARRHRLREQYFQLAFDASATCEDRITLTWNGMQTARLNAQVEDGDFDGNLKGILERGPYPVPLGCAGAHRSREAPLTAFRRRDRGLFGLSSEAARCTGAAARGLKDALRARFLRYGGRHRPCQTSVREQEAAGFADYLATRWQTWQAVLKRFARKDHAAMQARLGEAMGEEFSARLNQRLAEFGLTGNADAKLQLGCPGQRRNRSGDHATGYGPLSCAAWPHAVSTDLRWAWALNAWFHGTVAPDRRAFADHVAAYPAAVK